MAAPPLPGMVPNEGKSIKPTNLIKVKVGELEVIRDGTIVTNETNEPIDFDFIDEPGFVIRFVFRTDPEVKEQNIEVAPFNEIGALLTFVNFDNSLGTGSTSPIEIGTLNNKPLYFSFRIYALQGGSKSLHYTWLVGKEVKNG